MDISLPGEIEQDALEDLLLEGLQSGESTEMTRQDWDDIRAAARMQIQKTGRSGGCPEIRSGRAHR